MFPFLFPFWIDCHNPAGLEFLSDTRTSQAEVWALAAKGGWADYYQGDQSIEWGALTQSLYRVNHKICLRGEVSYRNRTSQNVTGSVFIDPTDTPFDMVEYNVGREGETQLEHYHLLGGVSGEWSDRWFWGLNIDFTAANLAKRRDLRHQNRLMQMNLSGGTLWHATDHFCLGLSYGFDRRIEGVSFNIAGTSDEDYYTLVSYGNFYGIKQLATSLDGYASTSSGMIPLVDERHQVALQLGSDPKAETPWLNEFVYTHRQGYYGRESLYSIVYTDHDGQSLQWRGQLGLSAPSGIRHQWQTKVLWEQLNNRENLYNEEQQGGGLTRIVYYGKMQRLSRQILQTSLSYRGEVGQIFEQLPRWSWQTEVNYRFRGQTTTFFPIERKQEVSQFRCQVIGSLAWALTQGALNLSLSGTFLWGNGSECRDKNVSGSESATTYASSLDRYLHHEYEFLTAPQVQTGFQGRYIRSYQGLRPYIQTSIHWTQAINSPQYIPSSHHIEAALNIGLEF